MIQLESKKKFLQWTLENLTFDERETYWLIGYLLSHDKVLEKVRFVEHAETTPRGICFADTSFEKLPFEMYKYTLSFDHAEQIFHELRVHWKYDLFIEFFFEDQWKNELYLSVLEDNPHYSWNTYDLGGLDPLTMDYLSLLEEKFEMKELRLKIDQALENKDMREFERLSLLLPNSSQI